MVRLIVSAGVLFLGIGPALSARQASSQRLELSLHLVGQRSCAEVSNDAFYEQLDVRQRLTNRSNTVVTVLVGTDRVIKYTFARTALDLAEGRIETGLEFEPFDLTDERPREPRAIALWPGESFERLTQILVIVHRPGQPRFGGSVPVGPHVYREVVQGQLIAANGQPEEFLVSSTPLDFEVPSTPILQLCEDLDP